VSISRLGPFRPRRRGETADGNNPYIADYFRDEILARRPLDSCGS
jgi:hypothetical protein